MVTSSTSSTPARHHDSQTTGPRTADYASIYMGNPPANGFDRKSIRSAFVTKVYSIVATQLFATSILIAWFVLHQPTKEYFKTNGAWWLYGALILGLVLFMVLVCIEGARRSFPLNFILLSLITVAYGLIAAVMSAQYDTVTVLCAFGTTALSTFVIVLLAKFAPFDITTCGCALCILALVHMFVTVILLIVLPYNTASLLIAGFGAFLVSLYLLFDLQLIMGGRSVELSPEEYILGAVLLYIDIIQLFQFMLVLFGRSDG